MNTNLALKQKPMTYEYQKPKKIKKQRANLARIDLYILLLPLVS